MPAPFEDYKIASILASKVGGPKNLAIIIAFAGALAAEITRPLWKPAIDSIAQKIRNNTIKVIDTDGQAQEMTADEVVSESLPELVEDRTDAFGDNTQPYPQSACEN